MKLVRDKIPDIIRAKGESCVNGVDFAYANGGPEFSELLMEKLHEEVREYNESRLSSPAELVDILEVVYALALDHGWSSGRLEAERAAKFKERGGFAHGIVLLSEPRKHTLYECPPDCDDGTCCYCRGGLASCTVCNGAEITLLPSCPGYRLTEVALDAIRDRAIQTVTDLRPEHRET